MIGHSKSYKHLEKGMAGVANVKGWLRRGLKQLAKMAPLLNKGLGKGFWRTAFRFLMGSLVGLTLFGCVNRAQPVRLLDLPDVPDTNEVRRLNGAISEVAPPAIFSDLEALFGDAQPQVAIAYPKPNQIIENTTLAAKISLRDLSIYKDENLELGPHLQISLDNQPSRSIYRLDEAIEFSDLTPGSHTLRVFAVKPWGESFKNEAAYAQTTFHVFAKTYENAPDPTKPQLIYSEPQGTYGAQPILLDFYLNNAPLHLIAKEDPGIADWKIRCDVNGQSFVFNQWQPIYLKGFKPGQNWVQITLIDEQDNPIDNAFNSTVRLINYDPEQRDTLAKLVRGELPLEEAGKIVDPNYEPPIEPAVEPLVEPSAEKAEEEVPATTEPDGDDGSADAGEQTTDEQTIDELTKEKSKQEIIDDEQLDNLPSENLPSEDMDTSELPEKEQDDAGKLPEVSDPSKALGLEPSPTEKTEMEDDSPAGEEYDLPEVLIAPNEAVAPPLGDEFDSFDEFAAEKLESEKLEAERLETERLEAKKLESERLGLERLEAEELKIRKLETEASAAEALEEKGGSSDEQSAKTVEQSVEDVLEEATEDLEDIRESTEDRIEETIDNLEESASNLLEDKTADFNESMDDLKAAIEQRSPTPPVRPEKSGPTDTSPKLFDRLKAAFQQFRSPPSAAPEPLPAAPPTSEPLKALTIPELSDKIQPEPN